MSGAPRARGRRWLGGLTSILSAIGLSALFGVGAAGALLAHLNLPAARRASADVLSQTLADLFRGQVSIGSISSVSPRQVEARDIVVRDEARRVVLKVTRLTARADLLDILRRLVSPAEKLTIVVDHVRVERAEAEIIPGADGLPTLAHAFMLRDSGPSAPSSPDDQYVRVWLPAVEIGNGYARGSVSGSPTLETDISGARGSVLATPKGAAIDVTRFGLVARGLGGADAKGVATLHIRAPGALWGSFDGYMGDVQFGSVVRYEQEVLDLKLDLPRAQPAAMRALLADYPVLVDAQARVRLKGKLPELGVDASALIGERTGITASGTLNVDEALRLNLDVEARQLDLRAVLADAPATSIDADAELGVRSEQGKIVVDVGGSLQPTTVEKLTIPAIEFSGTTEEGSFVGEAKIHDLGLPLQVTFSVQPSGKLELDAEAKRVNLAKVERLKPYFDGTGSADLRAHATLDQGRLDSNLTLDVRGLQYEGVTLQSARVVAGAKGSVDQLDQLAINARLTGKRLSAGRFGFDDVQATAFGPARAPTVTTSLKSVSGPSFDGRAKLSLADPVSLRELSLGVARDGVEIRGEVAQLDLAEDRVLVRELRLHGATGELSGNAELRPKSFSVNAQGQHLDLSAFSRVLGLPRGVLEGRASINVDAAASDQSQRGTLELEVSKASIANLNGISGQLSARLEGAALSGNAAGSVEALGGFVADWDTQLDGPPTQRASFERATGRATLALKDVTLDYLGQLLPEQDVDVSGTTSLKLDVSRDTPDAVPNLELAGETRGLRVALQRAEQAPLVFSGIELAASAAHDGSSGDTTFSLSATEGSERLVAGSADMNLDLKAALLGTEPLLGQVRTRPLLAKVVVNQVQLDDLPGPLRLPGMRGAVRLEGTLRGSVDEPIASLSVRATDLHLSSSERGEPIDVCGTAEYAKATGAFSVGAEAFLPAGLDLRRGACTGKRIANLHVAGTTPFDPERGVSDWSGTALLDLEGMPLSTIPALAEARMTGMATGRVMLDRSGAVPHASAKLTLEEVRADRLTVGSGKLELRSSADRAHAEFEVRQQAAAVSGAIDAGISWQSGVPALDDRQPIDASLTSRQLQASVLEPFLSDYVNELRGSVDGTVDIRLEALAEGEQARRVERVGGNVSFQEGSFILTGLGFRLRDVAFKATAKRDGRHTLVEVPDFAATAGTKSRNMSANIVLRLVGLELNGGNANVEINQVPLVVDGVTRANADASFSVELTRRPEKMLVEVDFNKLEARLPQETSRDLIQLNENPNITIIQPIAQPRGGRNEGDLPWHFVIHLGTNSKLERGALLDLPLLGDPNVVLAQELGVTGTIFLKRGGAVQMLGKIFVIEGGGVIFDTGDPKDPRLDVQASWRTPNGDVLFVYVTGRLSKPKLLFDRSAEQAWGLLASGDASDLTLNALETLLSDTPLARVQVRRSGGQAEETGATYTAAYRVNDRFIVEGNYQEARPDDSDNRGYVGAAVDWRIKRNISLRGQLGTIGTGVDLVYQYQY